ncbi:MAG: crotonobetainyl-CoA:carnitine CoA-transferase CaiB-like acyl-CoA transferase [Candidatus Azotimanducaceae bacterium]|jgi:crotonobetainyl-CoA:carnitine CoA-transferase CaiB-like acyl-CoA transferase
MPGPLDGVLVLDCTHVIAGAYCSLLLADLGADVIKIEPLKGEVTRGRPDSAFQPFDFVNRNKRAIAVNIAEEAGADLIRKLAETADIFVENFRPGALDKYGLGYEDLAAVNPRLVYTSISGFGHTGPYRERGGLDLVTQAMSGIMSFTGERGTEVPMSAGVPISDVSAGTFAALGAVAALHHKNATGEGQHLETSLLESAMANTLWETGLALTTGSVAQRNGTRHRLAAPYEALKTGDGYLVVGVNNQKLWHLFCECLGDAGLEHDPDYERPHLRVKNRDALQLRLEELLAANTTTHWVDKISGKGVPCGPINTIAEALADPHVQAREFLQTVDGRQFPRAPITMTKTPVAISRGPASIGQHTVEVLMSIGVSAEDIQILEKQKVIGT